MIENFILILFSFICTFVSICLFFIMSSMTVNFVYNNLLEKQLTNKQNVKISFVLEITIILIALIIAMLI